ncbi:MAG: serine/threonine protein kinase [Deltaproteobacteria bacterium]|nr:serine/threonine protein kinase [Deltaproteobacteria bacterium]
MPGCQLCGGDHAVGPEACPELRLHETIAGKYVIESLLGCGGICAVYAAHHRTLRRDIALKIVHPRFARDPELGARMVREARETGAINHTAFVPVFDAGIAEDGCAYIEMGRLEGRDLYTIRTQDGPLLPDRAVMIAIDVLDALEALHARGIIHRDLKSSNIYIEPGEKVRLLDLGMAKVADEYNVTAPNQLLGTPFYISPEQLFDPRSVDGRTDLFALGVVLFEVLTGEWPYQYEGKKELLKRVMKGEIERHPAARSDDVPIWLDHIVARALAFDREQRFASATEMRAALERGSRRKSPSLLKRLFGR